MAAGGSALAVAWDVRPSFREGGEGSRGKAGGVADFFRFDWGTRAGGRDMGTVSFSRAL